MTQMRNVAAVMDLFVGNKKVMKTPIKDAMEYYTVSGAILQGRVNRVLNSNIDVSTLAAPVTNFMEGLFRKYV